MNILTLLDYELKDKNWTFDEKNRYLYLRSCELFSYDPRYFFCDLFEDGKIIQEEILNRKINLEELETNWIVCTSYSKVVQELIRALFNKESSI